MSESALPEKGNDELERRFLADALRASPREERRVLAAVQACKRGVSDGLSAAAVERVMARELAAPTRAEISLLAVVYFLAGAAADLARTDPAAVVAVARRLPDPPPPPSAGEPG